MLWPKRRLRADQFALVPGFATCGLTDYIGRVLHSDGPSVAEDHQDVLVVLEAIRGGSAVEAIRPQSALPVDRQVTNWPYMDAPARQLHGETNSWAEYFRPDIGRGPDTLIGAAGSAWLWLKSRPGA